MSREQQEINEWLNDAECIPSESESGGNENEGLENVVGDFIVADNGTLQQIDYIEIAQENDSVTFDNYPDVNNVNIIPYNQFFNQIDVENDTPPIKDLAFPNDNPPEQDM